MIDSVFVYGTLKRGQCRESLWPVVPTRISDAWVRGALYGRNDYPAMIEGGDRVSGELWSFPESRIGDVLEKLDAIEGYDQPGESDLYRRVRVEAYRADETPPQFAWTYVYARDPTLDGFEQIMPHEDQPVIWPS